MKGIILHWDDNSDKGLIRGADELKYEFSSDDFKSQNKKIKAGIEVDFDKDGNVARNIYVIQSSTVCDIKDAVQETAVKTGTKLFNFSKVFIPLVVVVIALIAGGNYLLEERTMNNNANKEFDEYQLAKQKADEYFGNKQYDKALVIYSDLNRGGGLALLIASDRWSDQQKVMFEKMSREVPISLMQTYKQLGMFNECYHIFYQYDESKLLQEASSNQSSAEILRLKDECIDLNSTSGNNAIDYNKNLPDVYK